MRLLTTLFALLVLAVAASAAEGSTTFKHCGDTGRLGPQNVRVHGASCKQARNLARAHEGTCDLRNRVCYVGDYKCTRHFFGNSGTRVRCVNGARVVRFFYGT
jgi:hypothetical protein